MPRRAKSPPAAKTPPPAKTERPASGTAPAAPAAGAAPAATARDAGAASSVVRVGLVQERASDDVVDNLARTLRRLEEAAERGAKVVCTQELFRSTYFCQEEDARNFALAEPVPGPTTEALAAFAKRRGVVVVGSVFERRAAGLYHNTAVVIDADGRRVGLYRKMHVPEDPRFYEKFYFAPGDLGFPAFDTAVGRIGVLVCWDQWYPEAARLASMAGAQILFYPTAIGVWTGEAAMRDAHRDAWRTIQRAHAVANGVFVAVPNRVGKEGELVFWGSSFVARPFGAVLAEASDAREEALVVDCDLAEVERARQGWPFLRDRRIDAYGGLTTRWIGGGADGDARGA